MSNQVPAPTKPGYRVVPCAGSAHSNPHVDNCGLCLPNWGWVEVPAEFHTHTAYREKLAADRGEKLVTFWGRWAIHGKTAQGWAQFFSAKNLKDAKADMRKVADEYGINARVVYGEENPAVRSGKRMVGTLVTNCAGCPAKAEG